MLYSHPKYGNCKAKLRDLSWDKTNKVYMTEINIKVISFDGVKNKFVRLNKISNKPKSVDAWYEYGDTCYLIEFKNQKEKSVEEEQYKLQQKLSDSIIILSCITNINILEIKEKCIYIVVYREESNKYKEKIDGFSRELTWGLSKYKGFLCKKIYTLTKEEFNYNFQEHLNTNKDLISILKDRKKKIKLKEQGI